MSFRSKKRKTKVSFEKMSSGSDDLDLDIQVGGGGAEEKVNHSWMRTRRAVIARNFSVWRESQAPWDTRVSWISWAFVIWTAVTWAAAVLL